MALLETNSDVNMLSSDALESRTAVQDNRRKSGRVTRKPILPMSQPLASKRKRKRGDLDMDAQESEQEDAPSDSGLESMEESDRDADPEEIKDKKRRASKKRASAAKPPAKKTKLANEGTSQRLPAAARPQPTPRGRKPRDARPPRSTGNNTLYSEVFYENKPLDGVVAAWLEKYKSNNTEGMCDLVNFVIKSTGCNIEITVHDIADQDNVTGRLSDLQDEYNAQKIYDYPLISKTKYNPPFRTTLTKFFSILLETMHVSAILYEELALIENFQIWVTTLTSSAIRPFRHTATVISLAVASKICEITLETAENSAKIHRQVEAEKKKARNKARIAAFEEKIREADARREITENIMTDIFDTVFVHRYRDIDPKIRVDCVQSLGHWITTLPETFLEGNYLKYLGWVLSDTAMTTRNEVLKQLYKLYKKKDNIGGLHSFTERFRSRIVEMACFDSESTVRASAIELLDLIREAGLLEPDDIDNIGKLIYDWDIRVRKAVAGFFSENINDLYDSQMEEIGGQEVIEEALAGNSAVDIEKPRVSWVKLKCLVETLQAYAPNRGDESPEQLERGPRGVYDVINARRVESPHLQLAKVLYDKVPEIKDWEGLAGYLLFDHSTEESQTGGADQNILQNLKRACSLDEKQEVILLQVLNAAVTLNLSTPLENESLKKAKKKTAKALTTQEQEQTARKLAQIIPRLLRKFGAIPEAAAAVLQLEHLLNLDVFQELRQDTTIFSSLLDDINKQFLTHGNQEVLTEASAAFMHARKFEDLEEVTSEKIQVLWDGTIDALCSAVRGRNIAEEDALSEPLLTDLANTLRRILNLANVSDCVEIFESEHRARTKKGKQRSSEPSQPFEIILAILNRGALLSLLDAEEKPVHDTLLIGAMRILLAYFMWKIKGYRDLLVKGTPVEQNEIDEMAKRKARYVAALAQILAHRPLDTLHLETAGLILDVFTLFTTLHEAQDSVPAAGEAAQASAIQLLALADDVPAELQVHLLAAFAFAEKSYAKKAHKPLEADEDDAPEDSDAEEDEGDLKATLLSEQRLCTLTGKLVVGLIAHVIDHTEEAGKGKIRSRLERNKAKLGHNFKEILAYLDEPKEKKGKGKKGKQATAAEKKKEMEAVTKAKEAKSAATVAPEDDEEEMVDDEIREVEEDAEEDLRARGLVDDDEMIIDDEPEAEERMVVEDEDEIMGD
ncbi:MAG: hypothetical protein M1829_006779 [Trizodia sp. TS-e1964]|nr:MAG: hypothetical protein M1829_006779 [Trizodia sp. TS-e1964]